MPTSAERPASTPHVVEALPSYYPSLDGLRAISVVFVIYEHAVSVRSPMRHFHGYLGVDTFFVLSGFLITGLLLREELLTGTVDMAGFYIRRAFRILPLYWFILAVYVLMLQPASQIQKWTQMKIALPYFLTFNNDLPFVLIPQQVGAIFGLSWTLGVEEKFYFFWPILCFALLTAQKRRMLAGWGLYGVTLLLAFLSFKEARAYSGLAVGALLALICYSPWFPRLLALVRRVPAIVPLGLVIAGFALVDLDSHFVLLFSWIIAFFVAHLLLHPSWVGRSLAHPWLVWIGKRSYAMYLLQGFGIESMWHIFGRSRTSVPLEFASTLGAALLALVLATLVHRLIEEPARKFGKRIATDRLKRRALAGGTVPIRPVVNKSSN